IKTIGYVGSGCDLEYAWTDSIPANAFRLMNGVTEVQIASTIKEIGSSAFYGCSSLTTVYYEGIADEWSNITIGSNNTNLTNATIYYYSETEPTDSGNYWHYVSGVATKWD
ncbi:MAG: leucine-rich repeat protein, partial [Acholeplasmatales bacterium]|nr:leucine-rich repeat protein [Acholeplasmatales bacterium]